MTSSPSITDNYRVELPSYSGPLDLLLYLVRRHEIDLHDIPMAQLTQQYLCHLSLIEHIDIDLAGEFLVMAASLLEIKSAMLTPPATNDNPDAGSDHPGGQADPLDPRYELVQQLLAYKRFKDAARELDELRLEWLDRRPLRPSDPRSTVTGDDDGSAAPLELDLEDVSLWDLCEAFARIMETVGRGPAEHEVIVDDTPIALHAEDIVDRLHRDGAQSLEQILDGRHNRGVLIGLFLAMLELVKQRTVVIRTSTDHGLILELSPPPDVSPESPPECSEPPADTYLEATQESAESALGSSQESSPSVQ